MASKASNARGFSLVELLVAMVFTLILMAGMASVFKASLSTFFTSGELLSSARRNRMSIELLGDDLNTAEMFLTDLTMPPSVIQDLPMFCILPNMPIAGAGANDPAIGDELYFYRDLAVPFDGTLMNNSTQPDAADLVVNGADPTAIDNHFKIHCSNESYAKMIKKGMRIIFKDSWDTIYVVEDPVLSGTTDVIVLAGPDPQAAVTGTGYTGLPLRTKHLTGSGIVSLQAAQIVRYRIEIVQLDPTTTAGIPCLVRDQGLYAGQQPFTAGAAFVTTEPQQIITDNIGSWNPNGNYTATKLSGFKVYLSSNAGTGWAGLTQTDSTTGYADGWQNGLQADLNTQLTTSGRPGFTTTAGNDFWFRSIPTLVRVDVATRTATQRTEYSSTVNAAAYKTTVRSLVFVPRHSGLPLK